MGLFIYLKKAFDTVYHVILLIIIILCIITDTLNDTIESL